MLHVYLYSKNYSALLHPPIYICMYSSPWQVNVVITHTSKHNNKANGVVTQPIGDCASRGQHVVMCCNMSPGRSVSNKCEMRRFNLFLFSNFLKAYVLHVCTAGIKKSALCLKFFVYF